MSLVQVLQEMQIAQQVAPRLQKLQKSAKAMEAELFKEMMQAMKKTAPDAKFGDDFGGDTYTDMFDDAVANAIASKANLGLADMVYRSLEPRAFQEELKALAARNAAATMAATNGGKE